MQQPDASFDNFVQSQTSNSVKKKKTFYKQYPIVHDTFRSFFILSCLAVEEEITILLRIRKASTRASSLPAPHILTSLRSISRLSLGKHK